MVAEAVDSVSRLEERARVLARQIDTTTRKIDSRLPGLQTEISTFSPEKFLDRLGLGAKNQFELFLLLADRARVTRSILVHRLEDQMPPPSDLQRLQDEVIASEAELDVLRFAARHGFFPEDLLHQKEKDHRKLAADHRVVTAERLLAAMNSDPHAESRTSRRRRALVVLPAVPSKDQPAAGLSPSGHEKVGSSRGQAPEAAQSAETKLSPVRFVRKEGFKFWFDVDLPGGVTIQVNGKGTARTLEIMLKEGQYLTMRQIASKGWLGPETSNIPTVHKAMNEIAKFLSKPESSHVLDERQVSIKGERTATEFLIRKRQVASSEDAVLDKETVTTEVIPPSSVNGANEGHKDPVAEIVPPVVEINDVKPLPLGALVASAPKVEIKRELDEQRPVPDVFARRKAPMTNVIYTGLNSERPAYMALRTLATQKVHPEQLIRIACAGEFDPVEAVSVMVRQVSDILFRQHAGSPLDNERRNILDNFIKTDFEGWTDDEIVAAFRQMLTESLANVKPESYVPATALHEEVLEITPVGPKTSATREQLLRASSPATLPAYLAVKALATDPSVNERELIITACGGKFNPEQAVEDMVNQIGALLTREKIGRLNSEGQILVDYIRQGFESEKDAQVIVGYYRLILTEAFKAAQPPEPVTPISESRSLATEFTGELIDQVGTFTRKLIAKAAKPGFVTKGVAREADGSFGIRKLEQLMTENTLDTMSTHEHGRVYRIADLVRAHFADEAAPELLQRIVAIAEQELAKKELAPPH